MMTRGGSEGGAGGARAPHFTDPNWRNGTVTSILIEQSSNSGLIYNFTYIKFPQLISLLHDLVQNLDQGVQTDLISLDFTKAFDTVPHNIKAPVQT